MSANSESASQAGSQKFALGVRILKMQKATPTFVSSLILKKNKNTKVTAPFFVFYFKTINSLNTVDIRGIILE